MIFNCESSVYDCPYCETDKYGDILYHYAYITPNVEGFIYDIPAYGEGGWENRVYNADDTVLRAYLNYNMDNPVAPLKYFEIKVNQLINTNRPIMLTRLFVENNDFITFDESAEYKEIFQYCFADNLETLQQLKDIK